MIVGAGLVAVSNRYGYHRDELYFVRAGKELAFGYVDQPPLTPLLARAATELFGGSLVGLRLASAVAAALVIVCTGFIAREFGGGRAAQTLAAVCIAVAAYLLAVGHLLSTSTFDLLAWTALSWLVIRAVPDGRSSWLVVGVVAGVGLQNKTLVAFLVAGLLVGLLTVGPRAVLHTRWPWLAGLIALAFWAPYLGWQAANGWPQLELSAAIAGGSSGTSESPLLFVPYQIVLVSPLLMPVWAVGLWRLARDPVLRAFRSVAVAYGVLALIFLVTGGKPYYLAGLYPVLLAAGADPVLRWLRRRVPWVRATVVGGAVGVSAAVSAVLFLPLVPVDDLADTPIADINYDAGETVGWPALVRSVAEAYASLPPDDRSTAVVLTQNYGQAGAVDRYGPDLGLPEAFSGHNSYASWGPPPDSAEIAIVVGYPSGRLLQWFQTVDLAGLVDNGVGLDNDEQGTPIWICRGVRPTWSAIWPGLRHIG